VKVKNTTASVYQLVMGLSYNYSFGFRAGWGEAMRSDVKSAVAKRSVVFGGHKTSVSLAEPFWNELRAIADAQRVSVSNLLCGDLRATW
jgi:hypothetical protein